MFLMFLVWGAPRLFEGEKFLAEEFDGDPRPALFDAAIGCCVLDGFALFIGSLTLLLFVIVFFEFEGESFRLA